MGLRTSQAVKKLVDNLFTCVKPTPVTRALKILDGIGFDSSRWYEDRDGNVRVPVIIATTGVLTYTYIDDKGDRVEVREAKLPEEILSDETVFSAEGKPITDEHPDGRKMVDSTNFAQLTKGVFINPKVVGNSIHGELIIYDRELQDSIKSGEQYQVSPGFWSHTEFEKGTLDGEQYDAVQRDITINHIAIVKEGRAGDTVRVKLDSQGVEKIRNEVTKMQVKVDEHSDADKIKDYENSRDQSEHEEENEKDKKDRGKEEEEKDGGHEEEEKKEKEDQPPDEMDKLREENKMLREELKKSESKDSRGLYLEARDFALQHVTDSQVDQYHDDIDYYKRQVVGAAGYESKDLRGAKLDGAYDIAKLVLERENRVTAPQDRQDAKDSKSAEEKALAESLELNNVFEGKRRVA